MMNRGDLGKVKHPFILTLGQKEKDYLQHIILLYIFKHSDDSLIFKGGTCLQKVYGLNRFSEDLDFTINREMDEEMLVEEVVKGLRYHGFPSEIEIKKHGINTGIRFLIHGPLYVGTRRSMCSLKMDVSRRERVIMDSEPITVYPLYDEIFPYLALCMNKMEILAEKIRALLTRDATRDLYDLFFLVKKGIEPNMDMVKEKLKFYDMEFETKSFETAIGKRRKNWKRAIKKYSSFSLDFEEVSETVLGKVRETV